MIVGLFSFAVGARQSQEQQQPSLEETMKWLSEKLENEGGFIEGNVSEKIDLIDFQGCTVGYRWTRLERFAGVAIGIWTKQSFPLTAIDPDSVKVVLLRGHHQCALTTLNNAKKIKATDGPILPPTATVREMDSANQKALIRSADTLPKLIGSNLDSEVRIPFAEKDIAERFAKALTHAVMLCKARKEPF